MHALSSRQMPETSHLPSPSLGTGHLQGFYENCLSSYILHPPPKKPLHHRGCRTEIREVPERTLQRCIWPPLAASVLWNKGSSGIFSMSKR